MSLGGNGQSPALNSAAANAVSAGLFMAVAAGNSAQDASNTCPASEPSVFTVGATNSTDFFAYYSNYGSVVDMLAPGDMILSTYINGLVVSCSSHPWHHILMAFRDTCRALPWQPLILPVSPPTYWLLRDKRVLMHLLPASSPLVSRIRSKESRPGL